MKYLFIFVLFTLIVIVKGAWWAAVVQPVILGLGAILAAFDSDVLNTQSIELKFKSPFKSKKAAISKFSEDSDDYDDDGFHKSSEHYTKKNKSGSIPLEEVEIDGVPYKDLTD